MVTSQERTQTTEIILENGAVKLLIRPDLGGRIDQFLDCQTGRDWVWHIPNYDATQTRSLPVGANFDDAWQGGWDEVFPNDMVQEFQGRRLVDHGELWSQPWQIVESSAQSVVLRYACQTVPIVVEKAIYLHDFEPEVRVEYGLQNLSNEPIPFLLKLHAAIAIREGDEILLPDCQVEPVTLDFSKIIGRNEKTHFPKAFAADGSEVDLCQIRPRDSQLQEFYYASDLAVGECGIRDLKGNGSLRMQFDAADFPYVWMFQSYGGWNDHYVLVMEPCTTIPYDLELACQQQTAALLQPHEHQWRTITMRCES